MIVAYERKCETIVLHLPNGKFWRLQQFLASSWRRGLFRTLKIAAFEVWHDLKFGGVTGVVIPAAALDFTAEARAHASDYFPSSYLFMQEAFKAGGKDWRGLTFVDFGCGMGRALLFASTLPFREIIGVELSPSLAQVARRNLTAYYAATGKTSPLWRVETADARTFDIPPEASVFYFFNPFDAAVLAAVADRLITLARRAQRELLILYVKPEHEDVFGSRGFVRLPASTTDFALFTRATW